MEQSDCRGCMAKTCTRLQVKCTGENMRKLHTSRPHTKRSLGANTSLTCKWKRRSHTHARLQHKLARQVDETLVRPHVGSHHLALQVNETLARTPACTPKLALHGDETRWLVPKAPQPRAHARRNETLCGWCGKPPSEGHTHTGQLQPGKHKLALQVDETLARTPNLPCM
jgi:hypothetical protein